MLVLAERFSALGMIYSLSSLCQTSSLNCFRNLGALTSRKLNLMVEAVNMIKDCWRISKMVE